MPSPKIITKGIVVRNIGGWGAFDGEEVDSNGRLTDASVNAKENCYDTSVVMANLERGNYNQYATCKAEDILKKGGRILVAPVGENTEHCLLRGITIKDANNLFSNHQDYPPRAEGEM